MTIGMLISGVFAVAVSVLVIVFVVGYGLQLFPGITAMLNYWTPTIIIIIFALVGWLLFSNLQKTGRPEEKQFYAFALFLPTAMVAFIFFLPWWASGFSMSQPVGKIMTVCVILMILSRPAYGLVKDIFFKVGKFMIGKLKWIGSIIK